MTKLYENCQRLVCIAYANEMADACARLENPIDPREVCKAAATKPFGYMPYAPGLGVGGHCIPVNPWYLLGGDRGRERGCDMPLLRAAAEMTAKRPGDMAQRIVKSLTPAEGEKEDDFNLQPQKKVLVVGVAFKRGQSLLDFSPGVALARALKESGEVEVHFADALVSQEKFPDVVRLPDEYFTTEVLDTYSVVVVAFKQVGMDFGVLDGVRRARVEVWGD
jgi:nucleotide sugar dehydrogenase